MDTSFFHIIYIVFMCYLLSHVWLFVTPWTVVHQAPLSMDSPGKNTAGSCYCLSRQGSP